MAGRIRQIIDEIIKQRARNDEVLAKIIKTRLILNGVNSDNFTSESTDDPAIITKLEMLAKDPKISRLSLSRRT